MKEGAKFEIERFYIPPPAHSLNGEQHLYKLNASIMMYIHVSSSVVVPLLSARVVILLFGPSNDLRVVHSSASLLNLYTQQAHTLLLL